MTAASSRSAPWPIDPADVTQGLRTQGYLADQALATVLFVACDLRRPLLLEGEAGVGKTETAKALAAAAGTPLIRLQCYEGIDAGQALYDWDFRRQILYIRSFETAGETVRPGQAELFDPAFLIERPILKALRHQGPQPAVLLIDEIDRADEAFEAFLLEVLSDYQVTVPEVGTIHADQAPWVLITSNRTRELGDATKRRCLYHWLDWPSLEREIEIVRARIPDEPERLARQVCLAVQRLRRMDLYKTPGIAETLDWVQMLRSLGQEKLDAEVARLTLGAVLKNEQDYRRLASSDLSAVLRDEAEDDVA